MKNIKLNSKTTIWIGLIVFILIMLFVANRNRNKKLTLDNANSTIAKTNNNKDNSEVLSSNGGFNSMPGHKTKPKLGPGQTASVETITTQANNS